MSDPKPIKQQQNSELGRCPRDGESVQRQVGDEFEQRAGCGARGEGELGRCPRDGESARRQVGDVFEQRAGCGARGEGELGRQRAWWSFLVVGGLLVLSLGVLFGMNFFGGEEGAEKEAVVVDSQGREFRFPLDVPVTRTISTSLGTNVVVVEQGSIRVVEADCENQICVHTGEISEPGKIIVCLPHKFIVTIESTINENEGSLTIDTLAS